MQYTMLSTDLLKLGLWFTDTKQAAGSLLLHCFDSNALHYMHISCWCSLCYTRQVLRQESKHAQFCAVQTQKAYLVQIVC